MTNSDRAIADAMKQGLTDARSEQRGVARRRVVIWSSGKDLGDRLIDAFIGEIPIGGVFVNCLDYGVHRSVFISALRPNDAR